jgi:hypothetical protein
MWPAALRIAGKLEYATMMAGLTGAICIMLLTSDLSFMQREIEEMSRNQTGARRPSLFANVSFEVLIVIFCGSEAFLALGNACGAMMRNRRIGWRALGYALEATTHLLERRVEVV